MISSTHNSKIGRVRALQSQPAARREAGLFVVEGVRLVEEALAAGWPVEEVYYCADINARGQSIVENFKIRGAPVEAVTAQVMKSISDTQTPQGLLALVKPIRSPLPEKPDFIFIPDGVRDPGNLGAMLRSAAGAGVQAVLLPPGTVDAFAPKVVRAGMGAHFRLALHSLEWAAIAAYLERSAVHLYLADAQAAQVYYQVNFKKPLALVIGGEAEGAGLQAEQLAFGRLKIPMPGQVESLNAAVAAGILLFEVARQRSVI